MQKISLVVITYNEASNIERCLRSAIGLVDELIVVDSFSSDDTVERAKSLGAHVVQHVFEGHIQQKNYAASLAQFDFVLSLDADEAIDSQLYQSILNLKSQFHSDAYYFNRFNNYCGYWVKHCGWYPDRKLRLFNKYKGQWMGLNPHDKYELFDGDQNTQWLPGNILHYSYRSTKQHVQQMRYFANIAAQEYAKQNRRFAWLHLLINPLFHFIKSYFLKLGFLDGWKGIQICSISSYGTFYKYYLLLQLNRKTRVPGMDQEL